jgi:hypothetical protein
MNLLIGWAFGRRGEVLYNNLTSRFQIDFSGFARGSILGLRYRTLTLVLHGGSLHLHCICRPLGSSNLD